MSDNELESSGVRPVEIEPNSELSPALGTFLNNYLNRPEESDRYSMWDVDLSAPRYLDISAIRSGTAEVRNIRIHEEETPKGVRKSYHFYAGAPGKSATEIHITGNAAEDLNKFIEQERNNIQQTDANTPEESYLCYTVSMLPPINFIW